MIYVYDVMGCGLRNTRSICVEVGGERMDARSMRRVTLGNRRSRWTYLAGEWNEMVFTEAVYGDFPDQDHLVMIFGEDGIVDNV